VRAGWPIITAAAAVGIIGWAFGLVVVAAAGFAGALFLVWFFRNPNRVPPEGGQFLVSPADGKVVEIDPCREERFLQTEMTRVGIFMSPVDVHVNRMPCAGKIGAIHYFPGRYLMAYHPKASLENEHQVMVIESDRGMKLLVVQIAGFLARRIEGWVGSGEHLECGERFGLIRLGSKVDLYLPTSVSVQVKVGDRVRAGESVIGVMA
jgi:phosphatidylserine decarboxylase